MLTLLKIASIGVEAGIYLFFQDHSENKDRQNRSLQILFYPTVPLFSWSPNLNPIMWGFL